jgi:hypothetical protein
MGKGRVPARLRDDALAGVDEQDREVGRRRRRHHVARVLFVAGGVGDDELARRGREVAIRDIDGDPLLALGDQAVGQQRQVEFRPAAQRCTLDRRQLIGEDRLGVVEQAPDQRALAVVDAAGGEKAQYAMVGDGEAITGGHQK